MKIGYARVSTKVQNLDMQLDELTRHGCEKIFTEVMSGAKKDRPALRDCLQHLRKGDVLVIWKLDRLGRTLRELIQLVNELLEREIGLLSLHDPIDTTHAQGRLVFNIFASLAEFERDVIRERTRAGLEAARSRGRKGGRPTGLSKEAQTTALAAQTLYEEGKLSISQICKQLSIARSTLYAYLRSRNVSISPHQKKR